MSTKYPIPPLREFPPGRLAARTRHLLAETADERAELLGLPRIRLARPRLAAVAGAAVILVAGGASFVVVAGGTGKQTATSAPQTSLVTLRPTLPLGQGHSSRGDRFTNFGRSYTCLSGRAFQLPSVGVENSLASALRALFESLLCRPVRSEGRAASGR